MKVDDFAPNFGLTGGVACGKSTVASYFRGLGAYIIDADRLAHQLVAPGQPAYNQILHHFGKGFLDSSGAIDRTKLGPRVFQNPQELSLLNSIVHPRVIARTWELSAEEQQRNPQAVVIVDAPLIFESGMNSKMRKVIVVWCRLGQQMERLMAKTGLSAEEAERRVQAQMPQEEKRRRADYQIDCSGTLEHSQAQAEAIYRNLQRIVEGSKT